MSGVYRNGFPDVDIVLWGGSGFVGRLLAEYLWPLYGKNDEIRFALGGKNEAELKAVHAGLGADDRLPLFVGDAFDNDFLEGMAKSSRLIASTVGPYSRLGSPLVAACAASGTDYCDLSGEPQWMYRMIDTHQKTAETSGARMVHACGFDSIPSDMGVWFLQKTAGERFGHPMERVKMRVRSIRGGTSGGTVASMLTAMDEIRRDPNIARIAKNPYSLAPEGMRSGIRQPDIGFYQYDPDVRSWIAPFVMGPINTRIVHRSNALMQHAYGKGFRYDEAVMTGTGIKGRIGAATLSAGFGAFAVGAAFAPVRVIMEKTILPEPGEGPSAEKRERGYYKLYFIGKDTAGNRLRVTVTGDRDPGYGSTPKMLGEASVCLLKDIDKEMKTGGFWTPATAMGERLHDRLVANAGLTFKADE